MRYQFPHIENATEILAAIKDRDEIVVGERDGFFFVDYAVGLIDTFKNPAEDGITEAESYRRILMHECRGIKFASDGTILARPYHKFFNVNERAETQHRVIDWSQPFYILDKMDGSMVHPIFLKHGMHFCTRMGITDVAENALAYARVCQTKGTHSYLDFCSYLDTYGFTPLFEWCSKKNRIVLAYPEDQLVLTGVRHKKSGKYASYGQMQGFCRQFNIPLVRKWDGRNFVGIEEFIDDVRSRIDEEGYVLRFYEGDHEGHMVKIKNDWYVAIHKAKDQIRFEKDVIRLHLSGKLDDVFPHLLQYDRDRIEAFVGAFDVELQRTLSDLEGFVDEQRRLVQAKGIDEKRAAKKLFAEATLKQYQNPERGLLFKLWDGYDPFQTVAGMILDNTFSSTQVNSVRSLFRIDWDDF